VRRTTSLAVGLILVVSTLGVLSSSAAWATPLATHVKSGSEWTLEMPVVGCEIDTLASNGTFTSTESGGGGGSWSGAGGATIKLKWTTGTDAGLKFTGAWTKSPVKEYAGSLAGVGADANAAASPMGAQLLKGTVASYLDLSCPSPPPYWRTWNSPASINDPGTFDISSIDPCPSTMPDGSPVTGKVSLGFAERAQGGGGAFGISTPPVNSDGSWSGPVADLYDVQGTATLMAYCAVAMGETGAIIGEYTPHSVTTTTS
jgi:hypothetical protein